MENNKSGYVYDNVTQLDDAAASSRKYLADVFMWMFGALAISAIFAYEFFVTPTLLSLIVAPTVNGGLGLTTLGYVAMFSPLAFSLVISFGFNRISYPVMIALFLTYAIAIGISFSVIGLIYTSASIFSVFITASLLFGVMAVMGYTTKQDLTKFGSILYMVFIGMFIASMVNFFIGSAQFGYIISFIFVAVFIGLTAYHIQMLKRIGEGVDQDGATRGKLVIIGAFTLYTTFINLFLSLLRVFGSRR